MPAAVLNTKKVTDMQLYQNPWNFTCCAPICKPIPPPPIIGFLYLLGF